MAEAETSLAETRRLYPWQLPQPPGQESAFGKSVTKKFLEMVLPLPYVCPQLPVHLPRVSQGWGKQVQASPRQSAPGFSLEPRSTPPP